MNNVRHLIRHCGASVDASHEVTYIVYIQDKHLYGHLTWTLMWDLLCLPKYSFLVCLGGGVIPSVQYYWKARVINDKSTEGYGTTSHTRLLLHNKSHLYQLGQLIQIT